MATSQSQRMALRAALLGIAIVVTALLFSACKSPTAPEPLMILNPNLQGIA